MSATAQALVIVGSNELEDLVEQVNREHQLVAQAGASMVEHAIRAGDALLSAKKLVARGDWERWLTSTFPQKHPKTMRLYMRLAKHQDRLRDQQPATITAAHRLLAGEAIRPNEQEMREEAKRLRADGDTMLVIANKLGVSQHAVSCWLTPGVAERRRTRERQQSRKARRALHAQERAREAQKVGGSVAKAYALTRKALEALQAAGDEEGDTEAKRALSLAMQRMYSAEDQIVVAVRLHKPRANA